MIRRILICLTLLIAAGGTWILPSLGAARKHVIIVTNGNKGVSPNACPFAIDNGCAAAPTAVAGSAAVFLGTAGRSVGGTINQLTGSSVNYTSDVLNTNRPGVDYPVGETAFATTALADPAAGGLPTGCTYSATGNASGGPRVTCTHPSFDGQTLSGWMFGSIGGHHCTALTIGGTGTGSSLITQNDIINDTGDCAVDVFNLEQLVANSTSGGVGISDQFINNTFDGQGLIWQTYNGACAVGTNCTAGDQAFKVGGNTTFLRNAFLNYWGRPYQYNSGGPTPTVGLVMTNNYILGCSYYDPQAHGECTETGDGTPQIIEGNTVIDPTAHNSTGLAMFPANLLTASVTVHAYTVDSNLIVFGQSGGVLGGATVSATVSNIGGQAQLTVNSISGGLMPSGEEMVCTSGQPTGANLFVSTVYTGSTGGTTSAGIGGGGNGGASTVWPLDFGGGTITGFVDDGSAYPSPSGVPGNVLSVTLDASMDLTLTGLTVTANFSGTNHSLSALTPIGGAVGGVGQYTVTYTGSPLATAGSENMTPVPLGHQRGQWKLPTGVSVAGCAPVSGSTIVYPFDEAVSDEINTTYVQNTESNNLIDMTGYGASKPAGVWVQRTGGTNSFTGTMTIAGAALTISGLTGKTPAINDIILDTGGVAAQTFISSGSNPNYVVSVPQNVSARTMQSQITACNNFTIFGGNVDPTGFYTSGDMNGYGVHGIPGNGCE